MTLINFAMYVAYLLCAPFLIGLRYIFDQKVAVIYKVLLVVCLLTFPLMLLVFLIARAVDELKVKELNNG